MERKTLIYQPSQAAATTSYANVSAPGGAFGDASGAMAGVGRDIQSVGESVGRIGQLRAERSARRDKEFATLRSEKRSTARAEFKLAQERALGDPSSEAYRARESGSYADFYAKNRDQYVSSAMAEFPLSSIKDETTRNLVQVSEQESDTTDLIGFQEQDNATRAKLRQSFVETQIQNQFSRKVPGPFKSRLDELVAVAPQIREYIGKEPGINHEQAFKAFESSFYDELLVAKVKNPSLFLFQNEEQANVIREQILASTRDPRIVALLETANPTEFTLSSLIKGAETNLDRAQDDAAVNAGIKELSYAVTASVKNGKMSADQAEALVTDRMVRHVFRKQASSNLTYPQYQQLKELSEQRRVDSKVLTDVFNVNVDGRQMPVSDNESNRQQFSILMAEAKELFSKVSTAPLEFAHTVNPSLNRYTGDVSNFLQARRKAGGDKFTPEDIDGLKELLAKYNTEVSLTLSQKGVDAQLMYRPGTNSVNFIPPGLVPAIIETAGSFAADTQSEGRAVREVFGRSIAHEVSSTLFSSSNPGDNMRGLNFLIAAHAGNPLGSDYVSSNIEGYVNRAGELSALTEQLQKDEDLAGAVKFAIQYANPKLQKSRTEIRAVLRGQTPLEVDRSQTLEGIAAALGDKIPGVSRGKVLDAFTQIILLNSKQTGLTVEEAANNFASGFVGQLQDAGLVVYTGATGRSFIGPSFVQQTPSLFGTDKNVAANSSDIAKSYSALDEWVVNEITISQLKGGEIQQDRTAKGAATAVSSFYGDVFGREGYSSIPAIMASQAAGSAKALLSSARGMVGVPFKRDISGSYFRKDFFLNYLFDSESTGVSFKSRIPPALSGRLTLAPLSDGTGWAVHTETKAGGGVFHPGSPAGLYIVVGKDGRPLIAPTNKVATMAAAFVLEDRTGGGRGWVTPEDEQQGTVDYQNRDSRNPLGLQVEPTGALYNVSLDQWREYAALRRMEKQIADSAPKQ